MTSKELFFIPDKAGFLVGAMVLATMTGCGGHMDAPPAQASYAAPPAAENTVVVQDDYVFYPAYGVYYSSNRRQYAYMEGDAWVSRPAPRGVSVDVLLASPSVRMDFHDAPERHHSEIVQKYPKNWAPPASHQDREPNRKDDKRSERDGK